MYFKRFVCIALAALMASFAVSCKKDKGSDEDINFSMRIIPSELELSIKEKYQLYVSFEPEDVRMDVEWSSDKPNITVSETGEVNAGLFEGDAVITARCGDKEAHCNVSVAVPVQAFCFTEGLQTKSLAIGEVFDWSVLYIPTYATDHNVVFKNSDPTVAELRQSGTDQCAFTVKAIKLGTTTITATCGGMEAELFIFVDAVKATSITVNPTTLNLECWESRHLTTTVEPSNATNPVSWTSLSPEIVEVSNGSVRGLRAGTGTVVACCGDQTAQCYVTVSGIPEGAVDLGLSVYWAECNLGASSPFDAGDYYAWGEIAPKSKFDSNNYTLSDGQGGFIHYDSDGKNSFSDYNYVDDAARQTLGHIWRVPTTREFRELRQNCYIVFEDDGVRFYSVVPGYVGQSIFFPLPEKWEVPYMGAYRTIEVYGCYWTSQKFKNAWREAIDTEMGIDYNAEMKYVRQDEAFRWRGLNIRPVW